VLAQASSTPLHFSHRHAAQTSALGELQASSTGGSCLDTGPVPAPELAPVPALSFAGAEISGELPTGVEVEEPPAIAELGEPPVPAAGGIAASRALLSAEPQPMTSKTATRAVRSSRGGSPAGRGMHEREGGEYIRVLVERFRKQGQSTGEQKLVDGNLG
jgi:hypothetical protein